MDHIPYGRQWIDETDIAAVGEVLRGSWLTTGPEVNAFEKDLAALVGAQTATVSSGTAALHCAYAAAGISEEAEVITTPLTFAATATAALHLGASVTFADVIDETLTIDPEAVKAAISSRTRVIAAVDYAGHPAELDELGALAHDHGALLVEDAAHSLGGSYRGRPIGSVADLTTFSFHPVKTITTGEGGAVAALDEAHLDVVKQFRNHGLVKDKRSFALEEGPWHQEVQQLGLNYRMPDVLAALGRSQMRRLDAFSARRRELVKRYNEHLDLEGVRLPHIRSHSDPVFHLYVVRIARERREFVFEQLRNSGIGVQVHYLPVHLQPLFASLGYRRGSCPVAESAYEELISLPLYPAMSDVQQDRVIEELRKALGA